MQTRTGL